MDVHCVSLQFVHVSQSQHLEDIDSSKRSTHLPSSVQPPHLLNADQKRSFVKVSTLGQRRRNGMSNNIYMVGNNITVTYLDKQCLCQCELFIAIRYIYIVTPGEQGSKLDSLTGQATMIYIINYHPHFFCIYFDILTFNYLFN